jgi:hypothetical protein
MLCRVQLTLMLAAWSYAGPPAPAPPPVQSIVEQVIQARAHNRARLRPYEVVRSYRLFGREAEKVKSEITAEIEYMPPDGQHYRVQKAVGWHLGEVVVRRILERENQVLTNQTASDITTANYSFEFLREDILKERRCYVLRLIPLRKDPKLLRGIMWVDSNTFLIHRLDGEPAKPPSWWVGDVKITLDFGEVEGMWLQTGLLSTANVRLMGRHTITSRDVEYRVGGLAATIATPSSHE